MLALSRSYVHMEYESITPDEIDALAEYAYEIAETAASEFPEVRPVGVGVRVEEGSIDIIVTIGAYASALFAAISGYGDFWDGLSRIMEHARIAGKFVSNQILKRSKGKGASHITTGHLTQLRRLFRKVESGELTADEATEKVLKILLKAGEDISQQFQDKITKEFARIQGASSEAARVQVPRRLVEYQPITEQREARPVKRVRRRGVEIWRNPEELTKNKRKY